MLIDETAAARRDQPRATRARQSELGLEHRKRATLSGVRGPGAAYDTGPAVYTFGQTPQPHNEGDFSGARHESSRAWM